MKNQCPNCHKKCISEKAILNAQNKVHKVACMHCRIPLWIKFIYTPDIDNIDIGDFEIDDWGNLCTPLIPKTQSKSTNNKLPEIPCKKCKSEQYCRKYYVDVYSIVCKSMYQPKS
jgi:hypothetical protein